MGNGASLDRVWSKSSAERAAVRWMDKLIQRIGLSPKTRLIAAVQRQPAVPHVVILAGKSTGEIAIDESRRRAAGTGAADEDVVNLAGSLQSDGLANDVPLVFVARCIPQVEVVPFSSGEQVVCPCATMRRSDRFQCRSPPQRNQEPFEAAHMRRRTRPPHRLKLAKCIYLRR